MSAAVLAAQPRNICGAAVRTSATVLSVGAVGRGLTTNAVAVVVSNASISLGRRREKSEGVKPGNRAEKKVLGRQAGQRKILDQSSEAIDEWNEFQALDRVELTGHSQHRLALTVYNPAGAAAQAATALQLS